MLAWLDSYVCCLLLHAHVQVVYLLLRRKSVGDSARVHVCARYTVYIIIDARYAFIFYVVYCIHFIVFNSMEPFRSGFFLLRCGYDLSYFVRANTLNLMAHVPIKPTKNTFLYVCVKMITVASMWARVLGFSLVYLRVPVHQYMSEQNDYSSEYVVTSLSPFASMST